ncbi:mycothiol system anti-sigma-R factor [Nesterenkonia natronophila]|jgi:mycothiol system anti-sigma-R factor|uniref:Mycothiol system anti-sigma-R factor n=1 Tax=Nesterenkonia natronophila TaxID=2174932 RepID=A0A3A4F5M8_9MICC|nr:mycothiol system anti-sigma-R factor [Nesterenkonia natronophila]RJN33061.1 mycothiol system anti-sigma-R factor [Nesterenkonia natronophila]
MGTENCRDCESTAEAVERLERIYEYLDGALSRDDINDVQNHLSDCPECASDYDLECLIRSVVKRSCTEQAPETLKLTIIQRISQIKIEARH